MKKIIVGFVGLMVILLPSEIAFAFGRGGSYSGSRGNFSSSNRYGGSTSHSYGSTSHSNAYGGSSSHTAGQGTTHDSAYGTSTSHNEGGGTTHTNAYGGKTSGEYGEGATHTNAYGGKTSGEYGRGDSHEHFSSIRAGRDAYEHLWRDHFGAYGEGAYHTAPMATALRLPSTDCLLWLSSTGHGELLRINMRQLRWLGGCRRCHNRRRYWCGCRFSKCKRCQC